MLDFVEETFMKNRIVNPRLVNEYKEGLQNLAEEMINKKLFLLNEIKHYIKTNNTAQELTTEIKSEYQLLLDMIIFFEDEISKIIFLLPKDGDIEKLNDEIICIYIQIIVDSEIFFKKLIALAPKREKVYSDIVLIKRKKEAKKIYNEYRFKIHNISSKIPIYPEIEKKLNI